MSRPLSDQIESERGLDVYAWSHFLSENRCPLFRKMLQQAGGKSMAEADGKRAPEPRSHVAGIIALVALAVAAGAWFWTTRQPAQPDAGLGLPHGVIVVGAGAFIAALIAEIRAMSFWEVLEAAWELILGLFSLIGAVLKGIWSAVCALFGWD
jgi:hypothetical protein